MQYLLTQAELDALVPKAEVERRDKFLELARDLVLKHAKVQCIHAKPKLPGSHRHYAGYCDDCPLSDLTFPRELGKNQICKLPKHYSK